MLDPGKDFMDLMASTTGGAPSWSHELLCDSGSLDGSEPCDLSITEGSVYVICWSDVRGEPIGNVGPFTVALPPEPEPTPMPPALDVPDSDLVVTFDEGSCVISNEPDLYAGEITASMVVPHEVKGGAKALTLFHLDEGKTMRDLLEAQDQPSPPDWAEMISMHEASGGSVNTFTVQLRAEPLYAICWSGAVREVYRFLWANPGG